MLFFFSISLLGLSGYVCVCLRVCECIPLYAVPFFFYLLVGFLFYLSTERKIPRKKIEREPEIVVAGPGTVIFPQC